MRRHRLHDGGNGLFTKIIIATFNQGIGFIYKQDTSHGISYPFGRFDSCLPDIPGNQVRPGYTHSVPKLQESRLLVNFAQQVCQRGLAGTRVAY